MKKNYLIWGTVLALTASCTKLDDTMLLEHQDHVAQSSLPGVAETSPNFAVSQRSARLFAEKAKFEGRDSVGIRSVEPLFSGGRYLDVPSQLQEQSGLASSL